MVGRTYCMSSLNTINVPYVLMMFSTRYLIIDKHMSFSFLFIVLFFDLKKINFINISTITFHIILSVIEP